jgi:hypothetical protein
VDMATLRAGEAAVADVLATAMLIDAPRICSRLDDLGAQAALRDDQGRWWVSDAWENAA